ncbi:MAG: cytochrome c biogenesis CcdA family protein [Acidimicrobiaceae bacterium]|nr:cytochrome c biogenesis CcdA family protein [Acidimicrobiaceae bacterium]
MEITLAYPFSLGIIAAFNPCGFVLLPAYLSYFVGIPTTSTKRDPSQALKNILRAFLVAITLTAGFIAVFGSFGVLFETVLSRAAVIRHIGSATIVIGAGMVVLGVWVLTGHAIDLRLPKLNKGTGSRSLASVFLFGVSYAVVSLSCTIGLFIAAVAANFSKEGVANGVVSFLAYAVGMGTVVSFLTVALSTAFTSVVGAMRKMFSWINPISGFVLLMSGVYLVNYGWWERQILHDPTYSNPLVEKFSEFQEHITNWINLVTSERLAVLCVLGVLGVLLFGWVQGEADSSERRIVIAAYVLLYLSIEFGFNNADFILLPLLRFFATWPARFDNWVTSPVRFGVALEILLTAFFGYFLQRRVRYFYAQGLDRAGFSND